MAKAYLSGVLLGSLVAVAAVGVISHHYPVAPVPVPVPVPVDRMDNTDEPASVTSESIAEDIAERAAKSVPDVSVSNNDALKEEAPESTPESDPDAEPELDVKNESPDQTAQSAGANASPATQAMEADSKTARDERAAVEAPQIEGAVKGAKIRSEPIKPLTDRVPREKADEEADTESSSIIGRKNNETPEIKTDRLPRILPSRLEQNTEAELAQRAPATPNVATPNLERIGENTPSTVAPDAMNAPGAIYRNAVPFENPEARPLMAVVLTDPGPDRANLGRMDKLPFLLSIIVDATGEDSQQAIDFYKDAGIEVILKPVLPENASPSDAEVNFQVQEPLLQSAVGVFMDQSSGFQRNSQLAAQIAEILLASGHGLLSQPQGLNTGYKRAVKAGVPVGIVFRNFADVPKDSQAVQRFLDNAAFKAGRESGVVVVGAATSLMLQALIEWNLGKRSKSVILAPISAVMLEKR